MVPRAVLDLDIEQSCWERLLVDLVRVGSSDRESSPSGVDMVVRNLDHGRLGVDMLPGSGQDPYLNYSSHYVLSVRIPSADDLAVGQGRVGLVA